MLYEQQVIKLLQGCEKTLAVELSQIRRHLRKSEHRAGAVWELLMIDALSKIGPIQYEPDPGGCPDIKLQICDGRFIWLEATYLGPRFWQEEDRSRAVVRWIYEAAQHWGISSHKIHTRLDGSPTKAGRVRVLPALHERSEFFKQPELINFFNDVLANPEKPQSCAFSQYTISISYHPNSTGPFLTSGGLAQEVASSVGAHALFIKLKGKGRQFDVSMPLVVCVGSDTSPALSQLRAPGTTTISEAISAACRKYSSLSAVLVVTISYTPTVFGQSRRKARSELFINTAARYPLTSHESDFLERLDFNKWTYTFPLERGAMSEAGVERRMAGTLTWSQTNMGVEIEIPAGLLIDVLAGKCALKEAFRISDEDFVGRALKEGWEIASCRLVPGSAEAGEDNKLVLELIPRPLSVFRRT